MTQKSIEIFMDEYYSKGPKQNYITFKTDVYHTDDIWFLNILDLKTHAPENNIFCKLCFGSNREVLETWLEISFKNPQTMKDSFGFFYLQKENKN